MSAAADDAPLLLDDADVDDDYHCDQCDRVLNDDIGKCRHCGTRKRKRPVAASSSSSSSDLIAVEDEEDEEEDEDDDNEVSEPVRKRDSSYYLQTVHSDTYNSDVEDFVDDSYDSDGADGVDRYESLLSSREAKAALPTLTELLPKVLAREIALYGDIDSTAEADWQEFVAEKRNEQAEEDRENASDNPENDDDLREDDWNSGDSNEGLELELEGRLASIQDDRGEQGGPCGIVLAARAARAHVHKIASSSSSLQCRPAPLSSVAVRIEALAQRVEDLEDEEEERGDAEGKARGELQVEIDSFCELAACARVAGLNPDGDADADAEDEILWRDFRRFGVEMHEQIMDGDDSDSWTPKDALGETSIPAMTLAPSSECEFRSPLLFWGERLVRAADPLLNRDAYDGPRMLNLALAARITNLLHDINLRLLELHPEWKEDERHARSLAEIRSEQARTDLCLPRGMFRMLVREVGQRFGNAIEYEDGAMDALQAAAEAHLIRLFRDAGRLAIHADRQTVQPKDLQLACSLLEERE